MRRLIIVARGRLDAYHFLRRTYADDPNVEVIIDRRASSDRRRQVGSAMSAEQRAANRRRRSEVDEQIRSQGHAVVELP